MENETAIIIAIIALIPGLYAAISQIKKDRLDAGQLALEYAKEANARADKLEKDLAELRTQFDQCKKELQTAVTQLEKTKPRPRAGKGI